MKKFDEVTSTGWWIFANAKWVALFKFATTVLSFSIGILLARLLGVADYGTYQIILGWIAVILTFVGLGQNQIVEREVARLIALNDVRNALNVPIVSIAVTLAAFFAVALIIFVAREAIQIEEVAVFAAAYALVPLSVTLGIYSAFQQGTKRIIRGMGPGVFRTALFAAVLAAIYFTSADRLTLRLAVSINLATTALALIIGWSLFRETRRDIRVTASDSSVRMPFDRTVLIKAGMPLLLIGGMLTINNQADILMLGQLVDAESAGAYHAATRMANFLTFFLAAMIVPLRPTITAYFTARDTVGLEALVKRSTRWVFAMTFPLFALFVVFGTDLLGALFGEAFTIAAAALAILSAGQLFNVACGPVQALLIMCGFERVAAIGVGISTATNITLNFLLIPPLGMSGAALATGISFVIWNVLLLREVRRRIGIRPTVF